MSDVLIKNIGVLYTNNISMTTDPQDIIDAVKLINTYSDKQLAIRLICADTLSNGEIKNIDILVNILGPYYPEEGWRDILSFYQTGGIILNVGVKPYSVPYKVAKGKVSLGSETTEALHSLCVVDEYIKTGPMGEGLKFEVLNPRYQFLQDLYNQGEFPEMSETYAINYHLAENTLEVAWPDEMGVIDSQLETICGWVDAAKRLVSVPITRVDHYNRGSLIFLNFSPKIADYYSSNLGKKLLSEMINSALEDRVILTVKQKFARYYEAETPVIYLNLKKICQKSKVSSIDNEIRIIIANADSNERVKELSYIDIDISEDEYSKEISIPQLVEGFYKVAVSYYINSRLISEKITGFYKISDHAIQKSLDKFKPITINTEIAPDFCIRDEKIFAMHGTTYFTTDVYRNCFINLNAYKCDIEMKEIKDIGFNILRTGNWQAYMDFYDEEGNIKEKSLRALDAFFYTAARYEIPIQFVLGAYVFNPWDRKKCPIHNPEMREKTIVAFSSFAQRFSHWPNVQVDALNEPSYSINGKWTPARPSGDEYERVNWNKWLKRKYNENLSLLRETWGITSTVKAFDEIDVPRMEQFQRGYDRKDVYYNYAELTDFYAFARESYSGWVSDIRKEIKSRNAEMLFMMGRDESIRIPSQQYEAYQDNFDLVNWHQWHKDSFIFSEYMLNRVRSLPCCAQEVGVYHYDDTRGNMRLSESECANVLERKLLYSFGNWIQWQLSSDPYMLDNCEFALGLLRADKSETPHMNITRLLLWLEDKTSQYMFGRDEDAIKTLTIHPSNLYYSVDSHFGGRGALKSILAYHFHLKMQTDMVLEHTFRKENASQIGNPKLIIFPAALMVSQQAWELLVEYMREGKTVLLSGYADIDEYWRPKDRFKELGIQAELKNISSVEKIKIGEKYYYTSFRECVDYMNPAKAISKVVFSGEHENKVHVFNIGGGKLIHCPIPLELGDSMESIVALYNFAIKEAEVKNELCHLDETDVKPNILLYPISYKESTLYTIVNEGEDDYISFTDLVSGVKVRVNVKGQRGCKIWLDKQGELIGAYINDKLKVSEMEIVPNGDLSIFKENGKWSYYLGNREKTCIVVNGEEITVSQQLYQQNELNI